MDVVRSCNQVWLKLLHVNDFFYARGCVCVRLCTCRCKPGFFNLQQINPAGCQPCFCYGHSLACSSSNHYAAVNITSDFVEGIVFPAINEVSLLPWELYYWAKINETSDVYFVLPDPLSSLHFQHLALCWALRNKAVFSLLLFFR